MGRPRKSNEASGGSSYSRRTVLKAGAAALGAGLAAPWSGKAWAENMPDIVPAGPASKYVPRISAAFVRRQGEYGMWWPGAVFDGEAALNRYRAEIESAATDFGLAVDIRPTPIYSMDEGKAWVAQAASDGQADGLLVVLLDRQQHAWPTAGVAVESGLPTIVFAPLGTAFTVNTLGISRKPKCLISCSEDFSQARRGMKMIGAGAKLREMRYIVLAGSERREEEIPHFGTKCRVVPAGVFIDSYRSFEVTPEIEAIADEYVRQATGVAGSSRQDMLNGVKSFAVAARILAEEEGDGITMDCLGALGPTDISLPCLAWSRMLDHGIPAACEADRTACVTHALAQFLFDRPGFQQDPVPETVNRWLTGAHCTCPTKLAGYHAPAEPYRIQHHHAMRDATLVPLWKVGQRTTVMDVAWTEDSESARMFIASGSVAGQNAAPPSGGCVVSVNLKLDGDPDLLTFPGFHQLFIYGDFEQDLVDYCKLHGIEPVVV
jgi:hypothetical protein